MDSKRKTKQNWGEYTTDLYRSSGEMSQTFTTDNEIFNLLADGTQHALSTEANLCQVSYEIQDESNKEFIPEFDNSYISKLLCEFRFRDGYDFVAKITPDSP